MKTITGNTYPVRDALKALGGRWNPNKKGWDVPDDKEGEALKLVNGAGPMKKRPWKGRPYSAGRYAPHGRTCPECGSRECPKAWDLYDLCEQD